MVQFSLNHSIHSRNIRSSLGSSLSQIRSSNIRYLQFNIQLSHVSKTCKENTSFLQFICLSYRIDNLIGFSMKLVSMLKYCTDRLMISRIVIVFRCPMFLIILLRLPSLYLSVSLLSVLISFGNVMKFDSSMNGIW